MTAAVTFDHVIKTYKSSLFSRNAIPAVRGFSLTIPQGSCFALLGPNRAGKTTLIKMLLSLATPNAGAIMRLGEPVKVKATLGRVGYMHENHAFPRYHTARDVLTFYGGLSGLTTEELRSRVDSLLTRVGLADRTNEPIDRFSKGMVQRLGLAQAIINDPDLLILDEPTEGLDLTGRQLLRDVIRSTIAAGKTVVLVSHVLPEVESLCDRAAVIVAGRLAFDGSMDQLKNGRSLEQALTTIYDQGTDA
jgi:ABC-2 type transport system ATP-binding protein